jgi:ribulose-phosphate 3-epimerase
MDRHFVPNLTFGPPVIKSLRPVQPAMYFDAHIMVSNPWDHVDDLVTAGVQCICFHVEAAGDRTGELLADIRSRGLHGGLAIKPGTAVEALEPFLGQMDLALVMTVEPGFGGQALIPGCLEKVRHLRRIRSKAAGHRYLIQVDGGINMQTAGLASAAGADVLVAGNAVYNNSPLADNIRDLHAQIRSAQP